MTRPRRSERLRLRTVTGLLWAGMLLNVAGAYAGVPNPKTTSVAITGQGAPCQFRFRGDGQLDEMIVSISAQCVLHAGG